MHTHQYTFNIEKMAKVLKLSRSGYYKYSSSIKNPKANKNFKLLLEIKSIYEHSNRTYGSPRIYVELRARGIRVNRKRVERLLRVNGIRAKIACRYKRKAKKPGIVATNLLNRNFTCQQPNQKWAGDISYIKTAAGWLYLAVILDLYSRKVVGMAMDTHMKDL